MTWESLKSKEFRFFTVNVKTGFSHMSSTSASCFAHVLALHVLIDFEERARRSVVLDADLDVWIGI